MMTRKLSALQEENKLQMALQELRVTKKKCDELINEREDSEKEMLSILNKNSSMRNELSMLHSQLESIVEERDQFKYVIDQFDKCTEEYEMALKRISLLEKELQQAHNQITKLELASHTIKQHETDSLFNELVNKAPALVSTALSNPTIVDLTGDETLNSAKLMEVAYCSRNKFKKYIKLNKFIKKTEKKNLRQKSLYKNFKGCKKRVELIDNIKCYKAQLDNNRIRHEAETHLLTMQITELQESLQMITCKYECSLKELEEHTLAVNELLEISKYNAERFESLQQNQIMCDCRRLSYSQPECASTSLPLSESSVCVSSQPEILPTNRSVLINQNDKETCNLVMFSDEIGKGMGHFLSSAMGHPILNNCSPNASYHEIIRDVVNCQQLNSSTSVVVLIGNRGNVNKRDIVKYCNSLSLLKVKEVVMFTFPYSKGLSQSENTLRYKLNLTMHSLLCSNKKIHLIDTNSIVRNFYIKTRDTFYLNKYCRKQIAMSLSYYFYTLTKNLVIRPASIEQNNIIDISAKYLANQSAPIEQIYSSNDLTYNNLN